MNLILKSYSPGIEGGGIPDEDIIRKHVKAYYYHKDRQLNDDDILPLKRVRAIVNEINHTHSEEIARLNKQAVDTLRLYEVMNEHITRLKEEVKLYEIDFSGNLLTRIKVSNNTIEIEGAMNGFGNGISIDDIKINDLTPSSTKK